MCTTKPQIVELRLQIDVYLAWALSSFMEYGPLGTVFWHELYLIWVVQRNPEFMRLTVRLLIYHQNTPTQNEVLQQWSEYFFSNFRFSNQTDKSWKDTEFAKILKKSGLGTTRQRVYNSLSTVEGFSEVLMRPKMGLHKTTKKSRSKGLL